METRFPPNSRYAGTPTAVLELADGREVVYLKRRFLPHPEDLVVQSLYTVKAMDRPDTAAWAAYGDAELFWRLADGNRAMKPEDMTSEGTIGSVLKVTLPPGFGGAVGV